jgi:hypothetical protein
MKYFYITILFCLFTTFAIGQNAWINEIHYDNVGGDVDEFIEVIIQNAANYTLSDFTITLYNGNGSTSYGSKTLDSFTEGATEGEYTFYYFVYPSNGIQNGASSSSDLPDALCLDYQGSVITGQFLSYEGTMTASGGPADGMLSTDIGVLEAGSDAAGLSLQLGGSGKNYEGFFWQSPLTATPGAINANQEISSVIYPEPSNHVTNFTVAQVTSSAIQLKWTGATGDQLPSRYIILGKTGAGTFPEVQDGLPIADDSDWSDGMAAFNVIHKNGNDSLLISSLEEFTTYDFRIYPYTNSGTDINFKTDGVVPATSGATTGLELSALADIRQNMGTYTGQIVKVSGTITHIKSGQGFYLQDAVAPWSGIYVFDPTNLSNFAVADTIVITGMADEYNDLSEITSLTAWETVAHAHPLPKPLLVPTGEFAQEQYESMLMKVENAECVTAPNEYSEWEVDDGTGTCIVDDYLYNYVPTVGEFYNIIGIGNYYLDYKLEPRSAADVELITNAPKISQVGISARVPMADEAFIDSVKIIAQAALKVTELRYMVNGEDENISAVTLTPVAGDTVFYGEIPESAYDDADAIEYWIYAEDENS